MTTTATRTGVDYSGNPEYTVYTDGEVVGTIVKVLPENLWFDGTASKSRPWVVSGARGYRFSFITLTAATKHFAPRRPLTARGF